MEPWKLGWGCVWRPWGCWGLCAPKFWWVFFTSSRGFFIPSEDCFSIPGWGGNPAWSGETVMTSSEAVMWDSPDSPQDQPPTLWHASRPITRLKSASPQGEAQSTTHEEAHKTEKTYLSVLSSINFYWSIVALQCCVSFNCKQMESAIHIPSSPLFFWISFSFRSSQSTEWSSLCCLGSH